jgi:hypothetical protein
LSGRTVAARKPEAKRNEEKRRRASARIHDTYKAVGVHLIPKGRMVQAPPPTQQQRLSGTDPDAVQVHPTGQESATGTPHSIEAADAIGISGMKETRERGE